MPSFYIKDCYVIIWLIHRKSTCFKCAFFLTLVTPLLFCSVMCVSVYLLSLCLYYGESPCLLGSSCKKGCAKIKLFFFIIEKNVYFLCAGGMVVSCNVLHLEGAGSRLLLLRVHAAVGLTLCTYLLGAGFYQIFGSRILRFLPAIFTERSRDNRKTFFKAT